jgi:uncharacterized protein
MLVAFTVENFRSYREPMTLRLVADSSADLPNNLIALPQFSLVRSAAVYGGNASGKSNLLYAMYALGEMLQGADSPEHREWEPAAPFALDKHSSKRPSRFSVQFYLDEVLYEYVVSVLGEKIEEERFSAYPLGREQVWFDRRGSETSLNRTHLRGPKQQLVEMTAENRLFLAVAAVFNHPQLSAPAQWLAQNFRERLSISASTIAMRRRDITARRLRDDPAFMSWANAFMRHADLGIQKIGVDTKIVETRRRVPTKPDETGARQIEERVDREERYETYFVHSGDDDVTANFVLWQESLGTRRLFSMLMPLYDVLLGGELAIIDELSASVHPAMVRELIRLFHEPSVNPRGAQLVFATHDATLLSGHLFRRDQIWFTEKNPSGATELYSLRDIKGVRPEEPFDKNYLRGRYGAIPFFGEFDFPPIAESEEAVQGEEEATIRESDTDGAEAP